MNQDQLKSLLTLCGGNNSSAKELNVKVDQDARKLRMDVITPSEISRYLRSPAPEYTPPQEVTDTAKLAAKTPVNNALTLPPTEVKEPPTLPKNTQSETVKKTATAPSQPIHVVKQESPILIRIAVALERIADVLEARFPEIEFSQPEVSTGNYPQSIELVSQENRILDDNANA